MQIGTGRMFKNPNRDFLTRVLTDRQYRVQVLLKPEVALSEYDLSDERVAAIMSNALARAGLPDVATLRRTVDLDLATLVGGTPMEPAKWYNTLHDSNEEDAWVLKMREAFSRRASHIGQFSWITTSELDLLIERVGLTRESRILDVCCGCGGPTLYTAWMTDCEATGLDFSDQAVMYSAEKADALGLTARTTFVCADALDMPFQSESFDAIISFGAFVNIEKRQLLLNECHRTLKPGGILAFYDQISYGAFGEGVAIPPEIFKRLEVFIPHYLLTIPTYYRMLQGAGFRKIQIEDTTDAFMRVNRAWLEAFKEAWTGRSSEEKNDARLQAEWQYLETLDELARTRKAGEAFCLAYKALPDDEGGSPHHHSPTTV